MDPDADSSSCTRPCLAAVSLHYGRAMRLEQMRQLAGTDRVGTNLLGMVQAAERLGFMAKAVKGNFDVLPKAPLPAVAHVRTKEGLGHFVVLHRVNVAVRLGDAGAAIDYARKVDLSKLPITERKAALFVDTAQAFTQ